MNQCPYRCWAEINLSALRHNLNVVRNHLGSRPGVIAIVKADAYGHGLHRVAPSLASGVAQFGVANLQEALDLQSILPQAEILLLGTTLKEERPAVVEHGFMPAISSLEEAEDFAKIGRTRIHLAVDTGMGRIGFLPGDLSNAVERIQALPNLEVVAVATHLPVADEDEIFSRKQLGDFEKLTSRSVPAHVLNSAGIINFPEYASQFVRAGLILYGISPVPEFQNKLKPVMTLKSRVILVRTLPAGHGVSYGRTWLTSRPTRVATLAAGYADGYPRRVSNRGATVSIRGTRCAVLGRITMDQIMVDIGDLPAEPGDEVELFGSQISASEIADFADTITWEIFTGISKRVPRIFLD